MYCIAVVIFLRQVTSRQGKGFLFVAFLHE